MKKLGIRFNDRDFNVTITNFLKLFGENVWYSECTFTKTDIMELFNQCAGSIYWISQNGGCYKDKYNKIPVYKYLTITEKNVYMDDEVTDFLKENDECYNGEFFYIEFRAYDYVVKSI